jgi:hypothetical protein
MGGSKSQPKQQSFQTQPQPKAQAKQPKAQAQAQVQPSIDPMIAYLAMLQQQQAQQAAAAGEAQKQAQIQAQTQAGQQAQMQSEATARQSLGGMNAIQQAQDYATLASQPAGGAGVSATGGGFDAGQVRQQSLQQMTGGDSQQPMANQGVGGTQQRLNKFATPATSGLTFGGS